MTCSICRKPIGDAESYFMLSDMLYGPKSGSRITLCEICAASTTVNDLFYKSLINMANCPDDVLEVDAISVSEPEYVNVKALYGVIHCVDKNAPNFNLVFRKSDDESEYVFRDDVFDEIEDVYAKTKEVWENTHDRGVTLECFNSLVNAVVKKYGFTPSDYGFPDPAYIRSDGTIGEVDAALLAGGGATQEDAEIYDDVYSMSEEDFLSKYIDNPAALEERQNVHGGLLGEINGKPSHYSMDENGNYVLPDIVKQAIRECDTLEEFSKRCPGYEEDYYAESEAK